MADSHPQLPGWFCPQIDNDELAVVWVGPKLDKVPQVGRGDHRRLFVNWY